jgi:hypothetical protein
MVHHLWVDNTSSDREINDFGRPPQGRRGTLASCYKREFMVQFFLAVLSALRAFLRSRSDSALELPALQQQVAVQTKATAAALE